MEISQIKAYLSAGFPFYRACCKDRQYFIETLQREIGPNRSLFVWQPSMGPDAIKCIQWYDPTTETDPVQKSCGVRNSGAAIRGKVCIERFNTDIARPRQLLDLMSALSERVSWYLQVHEETGTIPQTDACIRVPLQIPPGSVLVLEYLDTYLERSPELLSLFVTHLTDDTWTQYKLGIISYTPSPPEGSFSSAYGIPIDVGTLSDAGIKTKLDGCFSLLPIVEQTQLIRENKSEIKEKLLPALRGMHAFELGNTATLALLRGTRKFNIKNMLDTIEEVKAQAISNEDILTWLPASSQVPPEQIGGYSGLFEYLYEKASGFGEEAVRLKLDPPKGVVLLGPPGTGKSMIAKSLSHVFGLPTIFMDIAGAFDSLVGASENKIKSALKRVDAVNGCVLVIDEADKAFAGATGYVGDSGTARRVFGTFLTWLQEHTSRTYVVVTMNATDTVPPEFLRADRFDTVFCLPLPGREARREILIKHFQKRDVSEQDLQLSEEDWDKILNGTDKFNGAELKEIVKDSRLLAYKVRHSVVPTASEILTKIRTRVPMAVSDKERIDAIYSKYAAYAIPEKQDRKPIKKYSI